MTTTNTKEPFSRRYLPEFVYGAIDGTVTTFAIIAAVSGAHLSPIIVLIVGFSNVLADGFSMATSNYLSERSDNAVHGNTNAKSPLKTAAMTFISFVLVGSIPVIPFALSMAIGGFNPFFVSIIATAATFLVIGYIRGRVVGRTGFRSSLGTLLLGSIAATIAYSAGAFLESFLG